MKKYPALILISFFCLWSTAMAAHVPAPPPDYPAHSFKTPHAVVAIFLAAVDRGELLFFDKPLTRKEIIPHRVEYIYDLDQPTPQIMVYSEFRQPKPVPGQTHCTATAISATLNAEGRIVDSTLHLWPGSLTE